MLCDKRCSSSVSFHVTWHDMCSQEICWYGMEICPDFTNANTKSFFLSLNRFFDHLSLFQGSKGGQTTLLNAHICHLPTKRLDLHLFGSRQRQMLQNNSNAAKQLNKLKVGFTVGFQLLSPWSSESCEPLVRPQGD